MFKVYKGARRLPTIAGVPRTPAIIIFMISATSFMTLRLGALLVFAVLWTVAYSLCKYDDRMFRILWLWFITKGVNIIRGNAQIRRHGADMDSPFRHWKGSTYSPARTRWEEDTWK